MENQVRMTQEEKQLLLKDLCARLPYHPNCYCKWLEKAPNGTNGCVQELSTFVIDEIEIMDDPQFKCQICDVKPYLRPVSSMTDKEIADAVKYIYNTDKVIYTSNGDDGLGFYAEVGNGTRIKFNEIEFKLGYYGPKGIDWLNAHHFDYRGLIEKGLALEAPEGMYNC